jgi:ketosteroid isomerase-like protein
METMVNNAAVVAEMFDAFKRGDIDTLLSHMHPDITWTSSGTDPIAAAGTYRGREETTTFFSKLAKAVTFTEFDPQKIVNADDHTVVAIGHFAGIVNASGKTFMSRFVMIDEFDDDGLVTKFTDYFDTQNLANAHL